MSSHTFHPSKVNKDRCLRGSNRMWTSTVDASVDATARAAWRAYQHKKIPPSQRWVRLMLLLNLDRTKKNREKAVWILDWKIIIVAPHSEQTPPPYWWAAERKKKVDMPSFKAIAFPSLVEIYTRYSYEINELNLHHIFIQVKWTHFTRTTFTRWMYMRF